MVLTYHYYPLKSVTVDEISKAIKQLEKGKSAGPDSICAEHIIYSSRIIPFHLSLLFSAILRYTVIPTKLMDVFIVPIIKNKCGNISSKENYRPISLSCIISKLLERIILNLIITFLKVSDNQFAFKKNHSTTMCIYLLKQAIAEFTSNNTPVYTCFLDIKKAFDRINNDKLLNILYGRGVPLFIIDVLLYWFTHQKFYIRWLGQQSEDFNPTCGLRQGSVISPILFNIYLDDLSQKLNKSKIGCNILSTILNHVCYADDLVVLSPSFKGLRYLLKLCEEFSKSHDIIFNGIKSKCILFEANYQIDKPIITLMDQHLEFVECIKYLGVTITANQSDNQEISNQYRNICCKANVIIRKFNKCSTDVKNELFRVYCTNIYCMGLWNNYNKYVLNKARVCYNNSFRILNKLHRFCSASDMFVERNVMSFNETWRHGQWICVKSLLASHNPLVKAVNNLQNSKLWKFYKSSLYI